MKNLITVILFFAMGCAHTLEVPGNYIASNPEFIAQKEQIKKQACLVLTPEFKNYTFEKEAYNWAGGSMFPDKLTFTLGNTLSSEIANLCKGIYTSVSYADTLEQAKQYKPDITISAEIEEASLDLPMVRFADITAEVNVKYSVYGPDMKLINTKIINGKGIKKLILSKENYIVVFHEAIKDLLTQTKVMMTDSKS